MTYRDEQRRMEATREMQRLQRGEATPLVTPEPAERGTLSGDEGKRLLGMTFVSAHDNARPHVVTRRWDDVLICSCQANPEYGCWATKAFKRVAGLQ